jgi:hypothetical protein
VDDLAPSPSVRTDLGDLEHLPRPMAPAPWVVLLGLGLLFAAHLPAGKHPLIGVVSITALIAWPILGFITAVQSVSFFFRSKGVLSKLAIGGLTLTSLVVNWLA